MSDQVDAVRSLRLVAAVLEASSGFPVSAEVSLMHVALVASVGLRPAVFAEVVRVVRTLNKGNGNADQS